MNKPYAHIYGAEINKWIAGTLKLSTYLRPRSPHGANCCNSKTPTLCWAVLVEWRALCVIVMDDLPEKRLYSIRSGTTNSQCLLTELWLSSLQWWRSWFGNINSEQYYGFVWSCMPIWTFCTEPEKWAGNWENKNGTRNRTEMTRNDKVTRFRYSLTTVTNRKLSVRFGYSNLFESICPSLVK